MAGLPQLPRGLVLEDHGVRTGGPAVDTFKPCHFCVEAGDTVELLDLEDDEWWQVRRVGQERKGWLPHAKMKLLAHRGSESDRMAAGSSEWREQRPGEGRSDADREVAKLLAYQRILEWRAARGVPRTQLFLFEGVLDHPLFHLCAALMLAAHAGWAWSLDPSRWQLLLGCVLAFVAVDLLSTVYHLCLDYGLLSTPDTTVTDLHHTLPLNYNLFPPRKLLATSYLATVPLHAAHLCIHGVLAGGGVVSPTFTVYTVAAAVLGCCCGFVHNAAHRRRHNLPIPSAVWLLQDLRILLHPDVHAGHHSGCYDRSFSLFSGVTHPLTDRLLRCAWDSKLLPRTPDAWRSS